jgi:hypothetical protein
LFVANPDGSHQRQIQLPATFQSTDSPMFTPDHQTIIFSGSGLFVMQPGGSDLVPLLNSSDLPGLVGTATVDWIER